MERIKKEKAAEQAEKKRRDDVRAPAELFCRWQRKASWHRRFMRGAVSALLHAFVDCGHEAMPGS